MCKATILSASAFKGGPILWINTALTCGGIESQIRLTAKGLHSEGIKLNLLCEDLSPESGRDFLLEDCKPYFESIKTIGSLPDDIVQELTPLLLKMPVDISCIPEEKQDMFLLYVLWMLHVRPSIVHVWNGDFPLRALAACVAGVPKVLLAGRSTSTRKRQPFGMEGPDPDETYAIYKVLLQYPSIILTNNSTVGKMDYAHWLGLDDSAIHLTHNIAEMPEASEDEARKFRKKYGIPDNTKLVVGAFRFTSVKDPVLWIQTLAKVVEKRNDVMGVVWGDGPLYDTCKLLVAQNGLQNKILLPGTNKHWAKGMLAYNAFLLSSQIEGLPNVVLEVQSLGIPVVSTNAGGVVDIIIDGHTGWVLRSRKAEVLAEKLLFVLENSEWREKAAKLASKHIARNFSMQKHVKIIKEIYGSKLSGNRLEQKFDRKLTPVISESTVTLNANFIKGPEKIANWRLGRKMMIKDLTILMMVRNEAKYIENTLMSLLCPGVIIIVSNNGSTDGTTEILDRLSAVHRNIIHIKRPIEEDHSSYYDVGRNFKDSLRYIQTEYCMMFRGRDILSENVLLLLRNCLEENPDAVGVYPTHIEIGADDHEVRHIFDYPYAEKLLSKDPCERTLTAISRGFMHIYYGMYKTSFLIPQLLRIVEDNYPGAENFIFMDIFAKGYKVMHEPLATQYVLDIQGSEQNDIKKLIKGYKLSANEIPFLRNRMVKDILQSVRELPVSDDEKNKCLREALKIIPQRWDYTPSRGDYSIE